MTTKHIGPDDSQKFMDLTPGDYVGLTVSDSGHGISPDIADKIFDPYFTTENHGEITGKEQVWGCLSSTES